MATIYDWLTELDFDFSSGVIIFQAVEKNEAPGWYDPINAEIINNNHPILHQEFDDGFGSPSCPRFIAKDDQAIYFPYQYDGSTNIQKIWLNIYQYLDFTNHHTPYPGG
jgi:hypothetical protein